MLAPKCPVNEQRHAIFRTKCTIEGKVCELLIDSRCTENVISSKVIKVLNLSTSLHPNPYKIGWVKRGVEVSVGSQCKVTFLIGKKFYCEVKCDILDMDMCHLILGQPWQFDLHVLYDGRANDILLNGRVTKFGYYHPHRRPKLRRDTRWHTHLFQETSSYPIAKIRTMP